MPEKMCDEIFHTSLQQQNEPNANQFDDSVSARVNSELVENNNNYRTAVQKSDQTHNKYTVINDSFEFI